jgi:putative hydrolase of the HAD superfamily
MAIKAIFFDAAGTLIKPASRVGESYALIAKKYGKNVSTPEISERFRLCFDSAPPLAFPAANETDIENLERDWWRQLVLRVF